MAHRVTKRAQGRALRRPASALCRGRARRCRAWPATPSSRLPPDAGATEDIHRRHRRRDLLRRRADPRRLRQSARPHRRSPTPPTPNGALLIAVVTEAVSLGLRRAARRDGRRHRRRRGPVDRQRAEFRRPLCRPVRRAAEIRAPDAGPAVRRDGRRRGPARLRADAVDPRAAHPPREGDHQHLHQFRPLRAGLHHPHDAARRGGPARGWRGSTTPTRAPRRPRSRQVPGVEVLQTRVLQRVHHPRAGQRRAPSSRRWPARAFSAACRCRASCPARASTTCILVAATETNTDDDLAAYAAALTEVALMLNRQGRPSAPGEAAMADAPDLHRQPRPAARGAADLRDRPRRHDRRRSRRAGAVHAAPRRARAQARRSACPGLSEPETMRHYVRLSREELRHRHRALSARLLHDEAQSAPQREDGAAAGLRRHPSAAAGLDRAGRARADRPAGALAEDADRHAGGRDVAQGRRAWRALRHAGDQGRASRRAAKARRARVVLVPDSRARHQSGDGGARRLHRRADPGAAPTARSIPTDVRKAARPGRRRDHADQPQHLRPVRADVVAIAEAVHEAGAYFYCDGANFNAIVGKVRPGDLGVDAMHINLHKTFSTPHGGGGPGAGPVVLSERAGALRAAALSCTRRQRWSSMLRRRPPGSRAVRPDVRLPRPDGHVRARPRLHAEPRRRRHAPGLRGRGAQRQLHPGLPRRRDVAPFGDQPCMHEALFDDAWLKDTGVTTLDFAKAMIDEGYHPMTMYFPLVVHGAMLIEPTESESKASLDLFIDDAARSRLRGQARRRRALHGRALSRARAAASTRRAPRASRCCAGRRRCRCRRQRSKALGRQPCRMRLADRGLQAPENMVKRRDRIRPESGRWLTYETATSAPARRWTMTSSSSAPARPASRRRSG